MYPALGAGDRRFNFFHLNIKYKIFFRNFLQIIIYNIYGVPINCFKFEPIIIDIGDIFEEKI